MAPIEKLIEAVDQRTKSLRRDGRTVDYAKVEREIAEMTAAIERAVHHCTLQAMAIETERIEVHGVTYVRVAEGIGTYYTQAGPVDLLRWLFRRADERNGKTVDVIGLRAGVIGDGWLPGTAQAMAHYLQLGTSREAQQATKQVGRLPYSRASFERVGHLVGRLWLEHHADIEDDLIKDFVLPREAALISVALDRASVPMEERCRDGPADRARTRPSAR